MIVRDIPSLAYMTTQYDERKLIAELRKGSREAFEHLLDLYEGKVFGLVSRMVGCADAEDVAQEALVRICRSVHGFRGDSKLSTWVYRVAVNACLEYRRKRRPELVSLDEDFPEPAAGSEFDPAEVAVRGEVKLKVNDAIDLLPDIHRDVVILHELQGLTYQECAAVLGCPVGTVKSRLSNAFVKLRELLKEYASESRVVI
jgi:RNA polymerase sigma-70 factor (ECF subfamily)